MKFAPSQKIGRQGQRFVESFVEEKLGFIYRPVDEVDIGVDGEIEILDAERMSTGGLLKVQVKTSKESNTGNKIGVYFDEKHMDYYSSLVVPPILVVVSLADEDLWWVPILGKNVYRKAKKNFYISLDAEEDRMTKSSARLIRMIGEQSNGIIAKYIIEEIEQQLSDINVQEESGDFDRISLSFWADTLLLAEKNMRDAACLLRYERRCSHEIDSIMRRYEDIALGIDSRKRWFFENGCEDLLEGREGWIPN
ncbi:hypothetical protein FHS78_001814 [Parvibaculum indicum]|uniref:DUF4365 domain-containing protein n=1 Tax=Parvibaculum indicum TaxID=562969 RepID=UPI0014201DCB|nr:DUF4365 domain-containing protein [Parvibaculum indicum]NIJ41524.1 hypothetical protein [Parvibaculum indicum]